MNDAAGTAPGAALARLRPLLAPRSIAVVGATPREGSFGRAALAQIVASGFKGAIHPINPRYNEVLGLRCYPALDALPEVPDHAVIVVANAQVEQAIDAVIGAGVKGATMFASCYLEGDRDPPLTDRIRAKARGAGLRLCGANCLGFQNREQPLAVGVFPVGDLTPGHIAVVSHSGAAYLSMSTLDPRFRVNLIVSAGQELTVGAADYMAYALDLPSTRIVALFLETVRDPAGFVAALERANAQDVPVVALKVGRTERSARLAQTHSGALAGNDAAYEAVFEHFGVHRVDSVDELTATALLFASPRRYVRGGLGAVLDSGGQRGMMLDLAARLGVPIAEIGQDARDKVAGVLDYGLEPVNPVDAWGTGKDYRTVFGTCYRALAADPAVGIVALFSDVSSEDPVVVDFLAEFCAAADETPDKPFLVVLNWSRCFGPHLHLGALDRGIAVLDGL
ncbi:MAG: CoA-binding protein, partial [Alphaproteobacteria bacterium]